MESKNIYSVPIKAQYKIQPAPLHEEHTRYALDFMVPVGTPVFAAAAGIVTLVKNNADECGGSNFIIVRHKNDECSRYLHLQHKGAIVERGWIVGRGQLIARSGQTGFSGYSHLHFEIFRRSAGGRILSLEPRFNIDGRVQTLVSPDRFTPDESLKEKVFWLIKDEPFSVAAQNNKLLLFGSKEKADRYIAGNFFRGARSFYLTEDEIRIMVKSMFKKAIIDGEKTVVL